MKLTQTPLVAPSPSEDPLSPEQREAVEGCRDLLLAAIYTEKNNFAAFDTLAVLRMIRLIDQAYPAPSSKRPPYWVLDIYLDETYVSSAIFDSKESLDTECPTILQGMAEWGSTFGRRQIRTEAKPFGGLSND